MNHGIQNVVELNSRWSLFCRDKEVTYEVSLLQFSSGAKYSEAETLYIYNSLINVALNIFSGTCIIKVFSFFK